MCWGVGGGKERCVGSGEVWGGCGKVYGVSGEVCWRMGKGCGEGNGEDVGKCVEVWGPKTLLIPHISLHLLLPPPHPITLSYTSFHTSSHIPPPSPHTFSYYPHVPLHLLKVWRSYHVTKFLWRSYCGEVTMWRSYWLPYGPLHTTHPLKKDHQTTVQVFMSRSGLQNSTAHKLRTFKK